MNETLPLISDGTLGRLVRAVHAATFDDLDMHSCREVTDAIVEHLCEDRLAAALDVARRAAGRYPSNSANMLLLVLEAANEEAAREHDRRDQR